MNRRSIFKFLAGLLPTVITSKFAAAEPPKTATITLSLPTLFPTPVEIQGFSADDVYDMDSVPQIDEALFTEAVRQLADKIAVEDDQSWRSTLRDRFAAWMSDVGDCTPVADEISEECIAMTEAHLRIRGRVHAPAQG